jgi:hypothetical protein
MTLTTYEAVHAIATGKDYIDTWTATAGGTAPTVIVLARITFSTSSTSISQFNSFSVVYDATGKATINATISGTQDMIKSGMLSSWETNGTPKGNYKKVFAISGDGIVVDNSNPPYTMVITEGSVSGKWYSTQKRTDTSTTTLKYTVDAGKIVSDVIIQIQ